MTSQHRIYFDENESDEIGRFDLGIPGSLADIGPIIKSLAIGMRVTLYNDDDGDGVEAILEFDTRSKRWMGRPVEGTWTNCGPKIDQNSN